MNSNYTRAVSRKAVEVLLISPLDDDHQRLAGILRHSNWRLHGVHTQAESLEFLRENVTPVVICTSELPDGTWRDLLFQLGRIGRPPLLVVASRLADERLWAEALNLGAYNVLAKPFDTTEVLHVVGQASRAWIERREPAQVLARTA